MLGARRPVQGLAPNVPVATILTGGAAATPGPTSPHSSPMASPLSSMGSPLSSGDSPPSSGDSLVRCPDGAPPAGYWQRVGAFILDGLITAVITFILGGYFLMRALQPWLDAFTQALNSTDPTAFENLSQDLSVYMTGSDFYTFVGISVIVGLIYHVAFLTRFGATPGKMVLWISVRCRDTPGPLPLPVAVRRYFLTLATAVLGTLPGALSALALLVRMVDLLFPAWDPQRQALHDKIAATNVVQGKQVRQRD